MSRARTERIDEQGGEAGFSLIEALVALAVFAMAGVGLMQLQTQSIRTLMRVETRALAELAAQNQLTEAAASSALELGVREGEVNLGGRAWGWRREIATTPEAGMLRVSVAVRDLAGGAEAARVNAFVAAAIKPADAGAPGQAEAAP